MRGKDSPASSYKDVVMTAPIDFTKYRKSLTKAIPGISSGFNDPDTWISTGSHALNYLISGDFHRGIPLSKVCCFAGESGSGKSLIVSGNIVKHAQEQGIFCVVLDTENALDEDWLQALGVDTSEDKLMKLGVCMIDDVASIISDFMKAYNADYGSMDREDRPKVLFVCDSLGMLLTPTEINQFEKGDMKGDMGRKAKQLNALVKNVINLIAEHNVGFVATNHTYASQDMFDPDDKISGGNGPIFASSIVVASKKRKLKEDSDGKKTTSVQGIKADCKVVKSRFSKPFESVKINIPWDGGLDPYSGLFDMFETSGLLQKQGNRYRYVSRQTGEEFIEFRKNWGPELLDVVMGEFTADDLEVVDVGELDD